MIASPRSFISLGLAAMVALLWDCSAALDPDADHYVGFREYASVDNRAYMSMHEQLWNGMDFASFDTLFNVELGRMMGQDAIQTKQARTAEARVHVLGLQDTGTNLLQSMLLMNFGYRFNYYDLTWDKNLTELGPLRHGIWKHSNLAMKLDSEATVFDRMRSAGVVPLIMIRDGLSWMQSMHKAPYELVECVDGPDWLVKPCYHRIPGGYQSQVRGKQFSNLEEVWNEWMQAYDSSAQSPRCFGKGLVIRYEDLVLRPTTVMDGIAEYLGVQKPPQWKIQDEAAKFHGNATGRDEAMRKITAKTYLLDYTEEEHAQVCVRLNTSKMYNHGYFGCEPLSEARVSNNNHRRHKKRSAAKHRPSVAQRALRGHQAHKK